METVGIIGYGNMGAAIAQRIKDKYAVRVFDKDKNKTQSLENLKVCSNSIELVKQSEIIILAIKPQDFEAILNEIKPVVQNRLIISIAAGITAKYLKSILDSEARIIRVMPNMAAQIGQGITVLFKDKIIAETDLDIAWRLLSCIGSVISVQDEQLMNAATAVSGSGPAFFCYYIKEKANVEKKRDEFIKELTEAAVHLGFDKQEAKVLSEKTVSGIIAMLTEKNLSCEDIIKMVTSKGGTTQAGLEVLKNGGSVDEAVKSALKRADELGSGTPR